MVSVLPGVKLHLGAILRHDYEAAGRYIGHHVFSARRPSHRELFDAGLRAEAKVLIATLLRRVALAAAHFPDQQPSVRQTGLDARPNAVSV